MTATTMPDEGLPLLDGQRVPVTGRIAEPEPEDATLASPSNRRNRDPKVRATSNADERPGVKTPLLWAQLSIILFLRFAEAVTMQVISPFSPELIRSLNIAKDEAEVGYYVGIIQSSFFAAQACTILQWNRLSDHIGRKPVMLTGLFGLSLSMYCFALSKTFWGFVFSRALNGVLNGNVGVVKSAIVDMTDHTNLSLAYAYQPIAWVIGTTLGSFIGGALSRPAERFPNTFGNSRFLKEYPYFLPCAVPATLTAVSLLVTFLFLKETHPSPKPILEFIRGEEKQIGSEEDPLLNSEAPPQNQLEGPVSLGDLLTRDVIVACTNYCFLSLADISFRVLQPIFLSTPVALGGLGFDPPAIGTIMAFSGLTNGVFTIFLLPWMTDYFGVKRVYLIGMTAAVPCFSLFPITNLLARNSVERSGGLGPEVWVAIGLQAVMVVLIGMCYGVVPTFIATASPNKASLGATSGLAQLSVSIVRAVGPALASSIYSLSIDKDHHYMNGGLVYYVTVALSLGAIWAGSLLPKNPWKDIN